MPAALGTALRWTGQLHELHFHQLPALGCPACTRLQVDKKRLFSKETQLCNSSKIYFLICPSSTLRITKCSYHSCSQPREETWLAPRRVLQGWTWKYKVNLKSLLRADGWGGIVALGQAKVLDFKTWAGKTFVTVHGSRALAGSTAAKTPADTVHTSLSLSNPQPGEHPSRTGGKWALPLPQSRQNSEKEQSQGFAKRTHWYRSNRALVKTFLEKHAQSVYPTKLPIVNHEKPGACEEEMPDSKCGLLANQAHYSALLMSYHHQLLGGLSPL